MAGKAIYVNYESSYPSCILYYSSAQPSHSSGHSHKVGLLLAHKHEASLFLRSKGDESLDSTKSNPPDTTIRNTDDSIGQSNRGYPNPTRKETPTATNSEAYRKWLNDSMGASENTFDAQVEADNLHPR
jgi:hypothetical protein